MVGVRSMGLAFESVIGYELDGMEVCFVPDWQLKNLVEISNQRFVENTKRIERFKSLIQRVSLEEKVKPRVGDGGEWEDKDARRERKRAEGLRRAEALRASAAPPADTSELSV
jgi:tRNA wybutosine-synthesizing protein 3